MPDMFHAKDVIRNYFLFDNKKKYIYNEDTQEAKTSLQLVLCGFSHLHEKPRIFIDARFFVYLTI